jgi:hypothetical protein
MKPAKQLKRILRMKIVKQAGKIKVFGMLYPKTTENAPKFTTFFKQIKIISSEDRNVLFNVFLYLM